MKNIEVYTPYDTVKAVEEYINSMKKKPHGGKRKGAGRPKTKEDTVVMRIPISKVEEVKRIIAKK